MGNLLLMKQNETLTNKFMKTVKEYREDHWKHHEEADEAFKNRHKNK